MSALIINFEGREAKGLSKGRYDETFAGEDGWTLEQSIGVDSLVSAFYKLFFFVFSIIMLSFFIQVIWNYLNDDTDRSVTFYIELSSKYVG